MSRLFVYGTLMRGEPNHRTLATARFEREARTGDAFTLLDFGAYPAMARFGGGTVAGEVFEVDDATLARCDLLEGHPHVYRRERVTLDDGSEAWTYVYPAGPRVLRSTIIDSGSWKGRRAWR